MTAINSTRTSARWQSGALGRIVSLRPIWWGVIGLALTTLFFTTTQSGFDIFTYDSVLLACMGAVSLQVLQGTAGLVSVGTSGFLLIGAFGSVFMLRLGAPFPVDIIAASLMCGVAGLITGLPALRLRSLFLALATLAAYFISISVGEAYQSYVPSARFAGFFLPTLFADKGLDNQGRYWAWLLWAVLSVVILGASRLMGGRSGRAFRMIREHEAVSPTFGIAVVRYKLLLFTLSSMVIGLEGGLLAHFTGTVSTDAFTLALAFQYVAMIVIGGLDSLAGAIIGATVVVALPIWIPSVVQAVTGQQTATSLGSNGAVIVYGVLVIIFVTTSPGGIAGLIRAFVAYVKRRVQRDDGTALPAGPVTEGGQ